MDDMTEFELKVLELEDEELVEFLNSEEALKASMSSAPGYWLLRDRILQMAESGYDESLVIAEQVQLGIRVSHVSKRDHEAGVISDEQLHLWELRRTNRGEARSAEYLRGLQPEQRPKAISEAYTRCNLSAGWNFSGAVWQAVEDIKQGRTPCLDEAAALRDADQRR